MKKFKIELGRMDNCPVGYGVMSYKNPKSVNEQIFLICNDNNGKYLFHDIVEEFEEYPQTRFATFQHSYPNFSILATHENYPDGSPIKNLDKVCKFGDMVKYLIIYIEEKD